MLGAPERVYRVIAGKMFTAEKSPEGFVLARTDELVRAARLVPGLVLEAPKARTASTPTLRTRRHGASRA